MSEIKSIKLPPHSLEAEQSVLGGLMMNNNAWEKVEEHLVTEDFYRRDHRLIFSAMSILANNNSPLDAITVSDHLDCQGQDNETGGLNYLAELVKNTPSATNIHAYAEVIRERALIRELIAAANEIADAGFNPEGRGSTDLLDFAETSILKIAKKRSKKGVGPKDLKLLLKETMKRVEEMNEAKGGVTGLSTGFTKFDQLLQVFSLLT